MDLKQHNYPQSPDDIDFSEFYIGSGPRELKGGLCDLAPKYRMPEPPPLERWERAELDDVSYVISSE